MANLPHHEGEIHGSADVGIYYALEHEDETSALTNGPNIVNKEKNVSDEATNSTSIEEFDKNLPNTVTLLHTPDGAKLYLVGTAHYSTESRNDVSKVIQAVQPQIVMVELCKSRLGLLHCDEDAILQLSKEFGFAEIRRILRTEGLYSGLIRILMQRVAIQLTNELGRCPGGEFRQAFQEARKIPNCVIHIADRPIDISIQRALRRLSWWQFIKVVWNLMTMKDQITPEEVEMCKEREILEVMVASVSQEYPGLGEVFVTERDIYMTYCLQVSCLPLPSPMGPVAPTVVAVVGLGHVPGITKYFGKVQPSQIPPLLSVPPMALSSKILLFTFKVSFVGAILYVGYKVIPIPIFSAFL